MTRELLFRIWDKKKREMINNVTGFVQDLNKEKIRYFVMNKKHKDGMGSHLALCKDVVIEQYTGLKDKNGKKVFEGDTIIAPITEAFVVEWSKEDCQFLLVDIYGSECYSFDEYDNDFLNITGNIHNKEEK